VFSSVIMTNLSKEWPGTKETGETGTIGAPLLAANASWPKSVAAAAIIIKTFETIANIGKKQTTTGLTPTGPV